MDNTGERERVIKLNFLPDIPCEWSPTERKFLMNICLKETEEP